LGLLKRTRTQREDQHAKRGGKQIQSKHKEEMTTSTPRTRSQSVSVVITTRRRSTAKQEFDSQRKNQTHEKNEKKTKEKTPVKQVEGRSKRNNTPSKTNKEGQKQVERPTSRTRGRKSKTPVEEYSDDDANYGAKDQAENDAEEQAKENEAPIVNPEATPVLKKAIKPKEQVPHVYSNPKLFEKASVSQAKRIDWEDADTFLATNSAAENSSKHFTPRKSHQILAEGEVFESPSKRVLLSEMKPQRFKELHTTPQKSGVKRSNDETKGNSTPVTTRMTRSAEKSQPVTPKGILKTPSRAVKEGGYIDHETGYTPRVETKQAKDAPKTPSKRNFAELRREDDNASDDGSENDQENIDPNARTTRSGALRSLPKRKTAFISKYVNEDDSAEESSLCSDSEFDERQSATSDSEADQIVADGDGRISMLYCCALI